MNNLKTKIMVNVMLIWIIEGSDYFQIYVDELDKVKEVPHHFIECSILSPGEKHDGDIQIFSVKPNKFRRNAFNFMPNETKKSSNNTLIAFNSNPFLWIEPKFQQDMSGTPLFKVEPKDECILLNCNV